MNQWIEPVVLSPRVTMAVEPDSIILATAHGGLYWLWKSEIGERLPRLHSMPPGDDCSCRVRLAADGRIHVDDDQPAIAPLDRLEGVVTIAQIAEATGLRASVVREQLQTDPYAPKPHGAAGQGRRPRYVADEIKAWMKPRRPFVG